MTGATLAYPPIIQGGMGVGVSNWVLARAVSRAGHLGVVSGTGIDNVFVRRLQDGDMGGHLRRAMDAFPLRETVEDALSRYFRPDGRRAAEPYRTVPMYRKAVSATKDRLTMLASFAEVWLAREGHGGLVGLNLLTKVQMPNLATLYGAMLAGVDYVLMGAGIPREIPQVLDRLAAGEPVAMRLEVAGAGSGSVHSLALDPSDHPVPGSRLRRPAFLPVVSSHSLAAVLAKKATGRVDGFIVEDPTAGGHNAPPRGRATYNERGEPLYGERDRVDLEAMRALGLPFWLAGGCGTPEGYRRAREAGAAGIQVGSLFAYCDESGFSDEIKRAVRHRVFNGGVEVRTDAVASPTGFPFKVLQQEGTLSERTIYEERDRVCDLGYLRVPYERDDGRIGYRCPAEPVEAYTGKGGDASETRDRRCLCNALFSAIGQGQIRRDGRAEPPLITSGDAVDGIRQLAPDSETGYPARDVIRYLLGEDLGKRPAGQEGRSESR